MSAPAETWFKSSKSGPNCDNCVEVNVGGAVPGAVAVRDTKDRQGPALAFAPAGYQRFVDAVRQGGLRPSGS